MSKSIVGSKSYGFAVRTVRLCKILREKGVEPVLSRQLLKAGTSIGANIHEALNTQTQPDFVNKLSIAQKECGETLYWLNLLKDTECLTESEYFSIYDDAYELQKIIRSIILTSKANSASKKPAASATPQTHNS